MKTTFSFFFLLFFSNITEIVRSYKVANNKRASVLIQRIQNIFSKQNINAYRYRHLHAEYNWNIFIFCMSLMDIWWWHYGWPLHRVRLMVTFTFWFWFFNECVELNHHGNDNDARSLWTQPLYYCEWLGLNWTYLKPVGKLIRLKFTSFRSLLNQSFTKKLYFVNS